MSLKKNWSEYLTNFKIELFMMVEFSEKQYMRIPILWMALLGVGAILVYGTFRQILAGKMFGNHYVSDLSLVILTILYFIFIYLSSRIHLSVKIVPHGIQYRFFPFQIKERIIPFSDIKVAEVRHFSPFSEFGGWGIRNRGKKYAYTVSGKIGIEFHLKSRKSILIGTQRIDDFADAMRAAGLVISRTYFD